MVEVRCSMSSCYYRKRKGELYLCTKKYINVKDLYGGRNPECLNYRDVFAKYKRW